MLQVLWECSFIDVTNLNAYTVGGRKDEMGVLQMETSLKFLLEISLTLRKRNRYFSLNGESLVPKSTKLQNAIVRLPAKNQVLMGMREEFFSVSSH